MKRIDRLDWLCRLRSDLEWLDVPDDIKKSFKQALSEEIDTLTYCDCISRKEAILQIQRYGVGCFDPEEFDAEEAERFVIHKLNELLSIKPIAGKWLYPTLIPDDITGHMHGECSVCHKVRIIDEYCSNCGSYNGGE